jgi:transposase
MRFAGIDIGKESHTLAVLDEAERVVVRPTVCREDAAGYARLRAALGPPDDVVVVMEATGHYWQNLCAVLVAEGFAVAVLNPLRTHRFAGEDLPRAKTDALDAVALARFAAQKRPAPTRLPDAATRELRELVRLRDRWVAAQATHLRQLHRVVDLGFPEFTQHVRTLDSALATTLLQAYPTAAAFRAATPGRVAALCYDGRHRVGRALADALRTAAATSVGQHHSAAYQLQVRMLCEDLAVLWRRLRALEADIARTLDTHEVGRLLTTIDGIGPQTAARLLGELGDPAAFRDAAALASYVGVVPATKQSGKWHLARAGLAPIGHARLRAALWMPMLIAVRRNAWLRAFYERLLARGKPKKVALIAAMRKMLAAIYSVARSRQPFVPRLAAPEVSA